MHHGSICFLPAPGQAQHQSTVRCTSPTCAQNAPCHKPAACYTTPFLSTQQLEWFPATLPVCTPPGTNTSELRSRSCTIKQLQALIHMTVIVHHQ
jgi:hypothetical protein